MGSNIPPPPQREVAPPPAVDAQRQQVASVLAARGRGFDALGAVGAGRTFAPLQAASEKKSPAGKKK